MGGHYSEDKWIWENGEDFTAFNDWGPSQPNATATVYNIINKHKSVQHQHHHGQGDTGRSHHDGTIISLILTTNKLKMPLNTW